MFRIIKVILWIVVATVAATVALDLLLPTDTGARPPKLVNVANYGAIPNDGLDDTAAFQRAFAVWPHVRVPSGWYDVTLDAIPEWGVEYAVGDTPCPIIRIRPPEDPAMLPGVHALILAELGHWRHCAIVVAPWQVEPAYFGTDDTAPLKAVLQP